MRDTWAADDLPVLAAAVRRLDTHCEYPNVEDLAADTGADARRLWTDISSTTPHQAALLIL